MKSKKYIVLAFMVVFAVLSNLFVWFKLPIEVPNVVTLSLDMESTKTGNYQYFYSADGIFDIAQCSTVAYENKDTRKKISYDVPVDYSYWRLDFGDTEATVKIYAAEVSYCWAKTDIKAQLLNAENELHGIKTIEDKGDYIEIKTESYDPQCIFGFEDDYVKNVIEELTERVDNVLNILLCVAIDVILVAVALIGNRVLDLLKELYSNKKLIMNLAKNDFRTKYVGSYLGIVWAFVQPAVTVIVYWFVFQVGLRSGGVGDTPFILWLIVGLVPWFFFSDSLGSGTTALMEYQYLVKKIVFKISVLPVVKILSAMFVHLFFIALAIIICALYGYLPDLYSLQVVYYTFCAFVLSLALVYFTCSVVVFFRDTTQIVMIFLQVGIWLTPIMWRIEMLPHKFLWIFKMMPMYYIVMGYRDSLLNKVWFWENAYETAWFWGFTLVLFGIGALVFKKLKVHFADVL